MGKITQFKGKTLRGYFYVISWVVAFVAKLIQGVRMPFSKKKIHYADVLDALSMLEEGDFIVVRTDGELTTLLIPGEYKHSMVYIGHGRVVEAVGTGVQESFLADCLMKSDKFAILRAKNLTFDEKAIILGTAKLQIGKKYSFGLKIWDENEIYCSEIQYRCIENARPGWVELREVLGFPTFSPDDCRNAMSKFDLIMEIR